MGILLAPIIIVCFIIYILAIRQLYLIKKDGELNNTLIYFGIGLSFALYFGHLIYWKTSGEIWVLSPYFILPIDSVLFIGFFAFIIYNKTRLAFLKSLKQILLVSIVTTMTLYILLYKVVFDISDMLHIRVTH